MLSLMLLLWQRTVDDPILLWHQWVDVVDACVVGQAVANAFVDVDVLVVVVAILAIDGVSTSAVDCAVYVMVVVVVDVVDPFSLVDVVEAVVVRQDGLNDFDADFPREFAVHSADVVFLWPSASK